MSDGGKSPTKSDTADGAAALKKDAPKFTEREEAVMKLAWSCLKSGPPEIDMEKLRVAGRFNTAKTAQNTWGAIKKKLQAITPENAAAAAAGGDDGGATPKPKATPRKRGPKASTEDGEATGSPAKKARTPAKKGKAKTEAKVKEEEGDEDEEMS